MADREELLRLAERCEAADGPSNDINCAIWSVSGLIDERHCRDWCRMGGRTDLTRERYIQAWRPAFTADIQDAMKLTNWIPAQHPLWTWTLEARLDPRHPFYTAEITWPSSEFYGQGMTAATAFCAAALRAHAAQAERG